jgi:methylenetetrahydrofolate reductase (NADPH)
MSDPRIEERVLDWARSASIEMSPREISEIGEAAKHLAPGTRVAVTWMPRDNDGERIAAARAVRAAGFEPVSHIAARRVPSRQALDDLVKGLRAEADVRSVFVIGGDLKRPAGPYGSAFELLDSGALEGTGVSTVGIASYPEGHPDISNDLLTEAYASKRAYLAKAGFNSFAVTQFSFDADAIAALVRHRATDNDPTPLRVGLAGPASATALIKFAIRCGVATSARALVSRGDAALQLFRQTTPEPIIRELAELPDLGDLPKFELHFFAFGGFASTAAWLSALASGRLASPPGR